MMPEKRQAISADGEASGKVGAVFLPLARGCGFAFESLNLSGIAAIRPNGQIVSPPASYLKRPQVTKGLKLPVWPAPKSRFVSSGLSRTGATRTGANAHRFLGRCINTPRATLTVGARLPAICREPAANPIHAVYQVQPSCQILLPLRGRSRASALLQDSCQPMLLILIFLPRQSKHRKTRLGCRLNAGVAQWAERHGCRESAVRAWMPVRRGPTERRRSEGTRGTRAKPGAGPFDRSHALRGNAWQDALRPTRRGASIDALPRGAWERSERRRRAVGRAAGMPLERRQGMDARSARAHGASPK
ncbi:hypothetical protein SAMN03159444_01513 [Pseudomonas sp. NFACC02]|nr:hypothetical protein SAMN03159444_01513 [Pseudomonas sp. NFACC02]